MKWREVINPGLKVLKYTDIFQIQYKHGNLILLIAKNLHNTTL